MNKVPLRLAQTGMVLAIIIMIYGRFNIGTEGALLTSLNYALIVMYVFSIPNAYVISSRALKSKLHSKPFTVIVLVGYVLMPILYYASLSTS